MRVSEFNFELPSELIAQKPIRRRDHSRMMILDRKRKTIEHTRFFHFPDYFNDGDVLVLNESKVIPARVWGRIEEREIEFLFLREVRPCIWEVLCRPARVVNKGKKVIFSNHLLGRVKEEEKEGKRILEFSSPDVLLELEKIGYPPLPPYIKRQKRQQKLKEMDLRRYQTVYAKEKGSIAAPTAG
ncbi:MAG: S-adenosylmethionine:tRNA ribosyltransferase-isomerase, partial [Acidobacteriota bacterium]